MLEKRGVSRGEVFSKHRIIAPIAFLSMWVAPMHLREQRELIQAGRQVLNKI